MKAKASTVPGVGQPYESPLNAEVTIRNAELSPKVAAEKILEAILALKC